MFLRRFNQPDISPFRDGDGGGDGNGGDKDRKGGRGALVGLVAVLVLAAGAFLAWKTIMS